MVGFLRDACLSVDSFWTPTKALEASRALKDLAASLACFHQAGSMCWGCWHGLPARDSQIATCPYAPQCVAPSYTLTPHGSRG